MTAVHHAINYVEITVTDMDAAQHFYGTAFGWRFTDYAPAYAGIQAPEGDGEVGGLSLGQNVEPVDRSSCSTPTTSTPPSPPSRMPAARSPRSRTHSQADGASPSSTRAGTGSAYGAQPRQGSGGAIRENADPSVRRSSS
jgi:catechol 2,3-dioxygenase-like lactoylglutathione lyase family enzyme